MKPYAVTSAGARLGCPILPRLCFLFYGPISCVNKVRQIAFWCPASVSWMSVIQTNPGLCLNSVGQSCDTVWEGGLGEWRLEELLERVGGKEGFYGATKVGWRQNDWKISDGVGMEWRRGRPVTEKGGREWEWEWEWVSEGGREGGRERGREGEGERERGREGERERGREGERERGREGREGREGGRGGEEGETEKEGREWERGGEGEGKRGRGGERASAMSSLTIFLHS